MNKAFVREPDDTGQRHCPRCGSLGIEVSEETLAALLKPEAAGQLGAPAFFCTFPRCETAYFDLFERMASVESLVRSVYPKDPVAPICACFGLLAEEIELDVREGGVSRVRAAVEQARSPEAQCRTQAASGQSCIPELQRYYMRRRQEQGA